MDFKGMITMIKAILFDSGRTLNVPATGHWFITPNFHSILGTTEKDIKNTKFEVAMNKAYNYINSIKVIKSEEEEYRLFMEFYTILLKEFNYQGTTDEIIHALTRDNVLNDEKFFFFEDVEPMLSKLSEEYLLGVVSDTWPSLERVFANKDLRKYFKTFVMSSVHGSYKAEKLLFKLAVNELGLTPEEVIFIDDIENNLVVAEEFGMIPLLIDRYEDYTIESKYPVIRSLTEIEEIIRAL
jgi:putative hydrolase of the HAD superfamily